ncbi:undecaprenyl-diphosphate phosphatase [Metallosphaera tengchongensis]|uniref:Undecaprenyl-diphosphatase n=1 Tax=Metallosphaera tengchongensis TaxID=1532350 RepID=A0A6N0P0I9_9CREN|nr:undecaprenyl-diphosphate phosphatase [Metallosphaera tengchongensis]QKR00790.1 undecaprenyl-diphosphate phosphatase [Metallosphaera tengchongensis]
MDFIELAIVLGIVQGVSEWLPISSKTQILLISSLLLGLSFSTAYAFGLFMEIGTLIAAILYFRRELMKVLKALVGRGDEESLVLLKYLLIVTVVTGVVGVPLYLLVETSVSGDVVGLPMTVLGLVLLTDGVLIHVSRRKYTPRKSLKEISMKEAVVVGLAQGLAALPGVSRSGMTTSALILLGVRPEESFRLSFISLIPAALGAIGVTVLFSKHEVVSSLSYLSPDGLAISMIVATVVSLAFINVLLRFAKSNKVLLLVFTMGVLALISGITSMVLGF